MSYVDDLKQQMQSMLEGAATSVAGFRVMALPAILAAHQTMRAANLPEGVISGLVNAAYEATEMALKECTEQIVIMSIAVEAIGSPDSIRAIAATFQQTGGSLDDLSGKVLRDELEGSLNWWGGGISGHYDSAIERHREQLAGVSTDIESVGEALFLYADSMEDFALGLLGAAAGLVGAVASVIAEIGGIIIALTGVLAVPGLIVALAGGLGSLASSAAAVAGLLQVFLTNSHAASEQLRAIQRVDLEWGESKFETKS